MANTKNTPDNSSTTQRGQETSFKKTTPRAQAEKQPGDPDTAQSPMSDVDVSLNERGKAASNTGQDPTSPRVNESLREEDEADLLGDLSDDTIDVEDDADTDLHTDGAPDQTDPATRRS